MEAHYDTQKKKLDKLLELPQAVNTV